MPAIARDYPLLAAFASTYVTGFVSYGVARGAPETIVYFVAMTAAMTLVARLYRRVKLTAGVLWGLAIWGAAHMAGGLIPAGADVLYNQRLGPEIVHYDRLVHAFGFGFGTIAAWQSLRGWITSERPPTAGLAVIIALVGMGIGAFNEVLEFAMTKVNENSNVGGYDNTGWDLVFNMFGAAVAATWVARRDFSADS
ncbi:MAG TPA: DUF2238 domain-containing protein [Actinomycetota bacterium]|nr:DUF2238 domain-containing protein [Actinomycetota bacterium]